MDSQKHLIFYIGGGRRGRPNLTEVAGQGEMPMPKTRTSDYVASSICTCLSVLKPFRFAGINAHNKNSEVVYCLDLTR